MNSGQKISVSLLVSVALFAGFIFSVYTSVFNKIETRFYEPELINREREQIKKASDYSNAYIQNLLEKSGEYAGSACVKSFFSQTPTEAEVTERVRLSGELFVNLPALDGIRLLDKNARNLHYSSYSSDIVKQQGTTKVYKNYPDIASVPGENDFGLISIPESDEIAKYKLSFNKTKNLLNISIPVYDQYQLYRGNFVFYFTLTDMERGLIKDGLISMGDSVRFFINDDGLSAGLVTGLPNIGSELFEAPVLDSWKAKAAGPEKVLKGENEKTWVVLSDYSGNFLSFAEIYTSDFFELPETARILILVCVFTTLFLIVFLLFSFKIDDMVVIRSRIKKIQFAFVAEYLENKDTVDWNQVSRQIEGRKADLFRDVKKSLGRKGRKHESQVDALLNKSWDEIMAAIGNRQNYENQIAMNHETSAELKKMLEEVLSKSEIKVQAIAAPAAAAETKPAPKKAAPKVVPPVEEDEVEALDEVEELDDVESLDEVEEIEEVAEAEELDEVEEIEEIDEVLEDAEPIEEIAEAEELDEVEEIEEVAEAEELDEVEEIEEIDEVLEEAEPIEEIGEAEELDDVESLDEVEEIEEIDEVLEDAESIEEIGEAEELDEVEELDDVEALDEVEEITEVLEDAEPIEEIGEAEELDDVESLDEVEEIEEVAEAEELDEVEELGEVEELDDVAEAEELEEVEEIEEIGEAEELDEVEELDDVAEAEELDEVEELDDVAEAEELDEVEEIEEAETEELEDISIELDDFVEAEKELSEEESTIRDLFFNEKNSSFSTEDEFATVENVFAEELHFGESYIKDINYTQDSMLEPAVSFELFDPEFGDDEELIPVEEEKNYYSMAAFGANNNNVSDLQSDEDAEKTIIEKNGIFSISESVSVSTSGLDKDFKKLVDAVLR